MAALFNEWNEGILGSYLIEIAGKTAERKDDVTGKSYVIERQSVCI